MKRRCFTRFVLWRISLQIFRRIQFHQRALKVYAATAKQLRQDEANDAQLPYWLMTLNYGRHYSGAVLKWCKETLAELDAIEAKGKRRQ